MRFILYSKRCSFLRASLRGRLRVCGEKTAKEEQEAEKPLEIIRIKSQFVQGKRGQDRYTEAATFHFINCFTRTTIETKKNMPKKRPRP